MAAKPRILIAPLDWGLGHATRCVPIIEEVMQQGGTPVLGTAGRAYAYLKAEFPGLELIRLPSYNIRYYGANMVWNIGVQAPRLIRAVWQEHDQLQRLIGRLRIDAVISDNRFGCFSSRIPSVFITHQRCIQIASPPLQWLANRLNYWFIRQYDECWIPDIPGPGNLAGALSVPCDSVGDRGSFGRAEAYLHSPPLSNNPSHSLLFRHIGLLSRLRPVKEEIKFDILALLSGPEPQRSRLEALLIRQLKELPLRVLLVQGKTEREERHQPAPHIEVVSYLKAGELQSAMSRSSLVICRSGYSTAMDLAAMGKKALLIPTPGQTEQEYLARRLQQLGYCSYQKQNELNVERGIQDAGASSGFPKNNRQEEGLAEAVRGLLNRKSTGNGK
ncbi:MAG: hypothetical protein KDD19_24340 [Phaeodactylibacter sp.]|nr:hypothetical protein [Phaeodactylibacter sp.]MCB9052613.1 glycosyltransferase [Lewinellaceae bacterium]